MPKRVPRPKPSSSAQPESQPEVPASYPRPGKPPRPRRVSEPATYNLYEAKTQLSDLVDRAAGGEEIVIAKSGVPMALLRPLPRTDPPKRVPGGWEGKVWVADDFDDPLPPEIQKYFDDPQIFPEEWDDEGRQS